MRPRYTGCATQERRLALSEDGDWWGTEQELRRPEAWVDESPNGRIQTPRSGEPKRKKIREEGKKDEGQGGRWRGTLTSSCCSEAGVSAYGPAGGAYWSVCSLGESARNTAREDAQEEKD